MRNSIGLVAATVAVAVVAGQFLATELAAQPRDLGDIFLSEDNDSFDPGLPIGAAFPEIRALYQGREITTVNEFMGDRGLAFFAVRSADW